MPMNRKLYPKNWEAISRTVRRDAGWRCQCFGGCGARHMIERTCNGKSAQDDPWKERPCDATLGHPLPFNEDAEVVLTVAHLDQDPSNCARENLRAMCQPCHLAYDAEQHRTTRAVDTVDELVGKQRKRTRKKKA